MVVTYKSISKFLRYAPTKKTWISTDTNNILLPGPILILCTSIMYMLSSGEPANWLASESAVKAQKKSDMQGTYRALTNETI